MAIKYTPEQLRVINAQGSDILVAAAAGSGKTAVLVERILRIITDPQKPVDIDRLLVVTFTEAAAAEMRKRIADALHDRLSAEPENERLSRQVIALSMANISTIHSFCRKVIKNYFYLIDLDPEFRIGDQTELGLLKAQALEEIFEESYQENNQGFLNLVDSFGGGKTRDDGLAELILRLAEFVESSAFPDYTMQRYSDMYELQDLDGTVWAEILRSEIRRELQGCLAAIDQAMSYCSCPGGPIKYEAALMSDKSQAQFLLAQIDASLAELYQATQNVYSEKLAAYRGKEKDGILEELQKQVKNIRDKEIKPRLNKLRDEFFIKSPASMQRDIIKLGPVIRILIETTRMFRNRYAELKRERNIMDFSDLEHFCVRILLTGDPPDYQKSAAALELTKHFSEVMIDEYQDSNEVQELILSAVSDSNRFMVGDVKQSVYKFRRANPNIFIKKYERFSWDKTAGLRIDLSRNFRSRPEIIDAVNFLFKRLMDKEIGEIDYDDRAALYPGAEYSGAEAVEFDLIEYSKPSHAEDNSTVEESLIELSKAEVEAEFISKRIQAFLNPFNPLLISNSENFEDYRISDSKKLRPCRADDIVILVRSLGASAQIICDALKALNIDAYSEVSRGFFDSVEVQTVLSFLRIIDNPLQDIPLATVLHSPVYDFSPDELLEIRYVDLEVNFFECVEIYFKSRDNKSRDNKHVFDKIDAFLSDLARWRNMSGMSVSELTAIILEETGYYNLVGALPGGALRQANLRGLLERAARYESASSYKRLFHFIKYVERTKNSGAEMDSPDLPVAANQVRVMTVHKSKGLEFPVVFFSMLGKQFNRMDEYENVILHQDLGIGSIYVNTAAKDYLRTKTDTLPRFSLAKRIHLENLSEELRVLYVALTRAKEKLILTACVDKMQNKIQKWQSLAALNEKKLPAYYRANALSFIDLLAPCIIRHKDANVLCQDVSKANDELLNFSASFDVRVFNLSERTQARREQRAFDRQRFASLRELKVGQNHSGKEKEIKSILWWKYPYATAKNLPSKISISEIKRLYYAQLNSNETVNTRFDEYEEYISFDPPEFLTKARRPGNTQRGTAIHTVMEHLDINITYDYESLTVLIDNLIARNLLTFETAKLIPVKKILNFTQSELANRMRNTEIHRETPFVLGLTANEIYSIQSDEIILVHGIIDCWFEDNGIIIVDYKSDAVSAENVWQIAEKYRPQMKIYSRALQKALGRKPKQALLYFFGIDNTVEFHDL
ncbi:MAG: helicase-exonuclease AddAB subunit AddA [Clostridiales bacterium]|jgi:ATP-dependent helicase/nuclease subunit A|nr:helicase-exonuclease AddAB subunit AddA [Clostridiales bacterium]